MTAILTPQQLRARLVESYQRSYRASGVDPNPAALERMVVHDLELVDAEARAVRSGNGPQKDTGAAGKRRNVIAEAEQSTGAKLGVKGKAVRTRALHGTREDLGERWGYAMGRMRRILEGGGMSSNIAHAADTSEMPALAKEYLELFGHYMSRTQPAPLRGVDHNPFRGLSDRDASRLFIRRTEDICDKSTVRMGPWWVPK